MSEVLTVEELSCQPWEAPSAQKHASADLADAAEGLAATRFKIGDNRITIEGPNCNRDLAIHLSREIRDLSYALKREAADARPILMRGSKRALFADREWPIKVAKRFLKRRRFSSRDLDDPFLSNLFQAFHKKYQDLIGEKFCNDWKSYIHIAIGPKHNRKLYWQDGERVEECDDVVVQIEYVNGVQISKSEIIKPVAPQIILPAPPIIRLHSKPVREFKRLYRMRKLTVKELEQWYACFVALRELGVSIPPMQELLRETEETPSQIIRGEESWLCH